MKKKITVMLVTISILLSGCGQLMPQEADRSAWKDWYLAVNYNDYLSEDFPYTRSLLKLSGTIINTSQYPDPQYYKEDLTCYKIKVKDQNSNIWTCTYYVDPYGWLPEKEWEWDLYHTPLAPTKLEIGKQINVYGYNDKKSDVADGNSLIISVTRIEYQDKLYHCIDRYGGFAMTCPQKPSR